MKNLTVALCTLNEEKNIYQCLKSVIKENPSQIIVIDGSSNDKTIEIAKKFKVKIIKVKRKGLGYQRKIGIDNVKTDYVCILDADHRLRKGCLNRLMREMKNNKYDGIQASVKKHNVSKNYWSDCFDIHFKISHNIPRETIVIGGPCIYKTKVLKKTNFDPFITASSDDTDLSYRLKKKNYILGVGKTIIDATHRSSFKDFFKKVIWYGKGDAQFIFKHPERFHRMVFHQTINYPIIKNLKSIQHGYFQTLPFFFLYGYIRFFSMTYNLIKFFFFGTKDKNIYST